MEYLGMSHAKGPKVGVCLVSPGENQVNREHSRTVCKIIG